MYSLRVTGTGQAITDATRLIRVIVDPSASDGSFDIRNGGASDAIICSATKVPKDERPYFIELDIKCTKVYVTLSNCMLYLITR